MGALYKSLLLFAMNWLDAQLTLVWVRTNVATEGNRLMAGLLEHGDNYFLSVKLLIGAFAAYVLYRCSHIPIARKGMILVLGIYALLMMVHLATGLSAMGYDTPEIAISFLADLPRQVLTFLS
jgi:hypothetical protein